jgi:hypothetical protein
MLLLRRLQAMLWFDNHGRAVQLLRPQGVHMLWQPVLHLLRLPRGRIPKESRCVVAHTLAARLPAAPAPLRPTASPLQRTSSSHVALDDEPR